MIRRHESTPVTKGASTDGLRAPEATTGQRTSDLPPTVGRLHRSYYAMQYSKYKALRQGAVQSKMQWHEMSVGNTASMGNSDPRQGVAPCIVGR